MMKAAEYAREHAVPFFGICYGFQWATVEFARNVCGLEGADSTEVDENAPHKVIYKLRDLLGVDDLGGTMRLGRYACELAPGSVAERIYGTSLIHERHRHRFEFNCLYESELTGTRHAGVGPVARRQVRRDRRAAVAPLVRRRAVPPRVPVAAAAAASAVRQLRRRGAAAQEPGRSRPSACRRPGASRCPTPRRRRQPSSMAPVRVGPLTIGGGAPLAFIAGPCVIESPAHVARTWRWRSRRSPHGAACRSSSRRRSTRPTARRARSFRGPGLDAGLAALAEVKARTGLPILTDIHEPAQAARGRGGRRRAADPGVPVAPDRPARGRGAHRQGGQRQEGPVPGARRHAARRRQGHGSGQHVGARHRARRQLRLQQPRRGHARVPDAARARLSGGVRRDAQPAAAGRRRRRDRGTGRVHRAAGLGRRRGRRGRGVHGGPRGPGARQKRRGQRAAARPARSRSSGSSRGSTPPRRDEARRRHEGSEARPRPRPQRAADRGGGDSRARRSAGRALRTRRAAAARMPRPRHRHRHGQVGHHLPQDRGDALEHRHAGVLPAPGRGDSRRPRRAAVGRRRAGAVVQRRDRGAAAAARDDQAPRRAADRHDRRRRRRRWPVGRRRARLPRLGGGVPAQPGADGQHHGGAGARRRAGDDAARGQGLPPGGLRQPASRRQARQAADAGRAADARAASTRRSSAPTRGCPTSSTRSRARGSAWRASWTGDGVLGASSPTATSAGTWSAPRICSSAPPAKS